ncbi:MAG: sel1 repeat family protein [Lentisphaeria bacterium]|nr:sel1 repeat family protein [Lentisphaeria bacterium]
MKNTYLFKMALKFLPLLIMVIMCGCVTTYDQLPYMPQYPALEQQFDTSAIIEYNSLKSSKIDKMFLAKLAECKYNNLISGTHYRGQVPKDVRVLDIISCVNKVYNCENGKFLDTRILVMVRKSGVIWENRLRYPTPRYFQAFSQTQITSDERKIVDEIYTANAENAINNLFTIPEFRQALEPEKNNIEVKFADTPQGYWEKSKYYQSGKNKDLYEAARYALLAAEGGIKEAANYFADNALYTPVIGKTADYVRFVENMANSGNPSAQNRLALMYLNGDIIHQNQYLAFYWFKKAADSEMPVALYNVGHCYEYGKGVKKNLPEAFFWYRKAADKGFQSAIIRLRSFKNQ